MSEHSLHYDKMVHEALRGVVREALEIVARDGLPGDHHFYIAFATTHPGVVLPASLRERYEEEMTIVLQHQFWDLAVHDDRFELKLSFNGKPEHLVIPFAAMIGFLDPSVEFGLQFQERPSPENPAAPESPVGKDSLVFGDKPEPTEAAPPPPPPDDKIVTLDAFRKK
jgi:hypothetical protein